MADFASLAISPSIHLPAIAIGFCAHPIRRWNEPVRHTEIQGIIMTRSPILLFIITNQHRPDPGEGTRTGQYNGLHYRA